MKTTWLLGLGSGALAGLLDVALIVSVDTKATVFVLLESFLFWTVAGFLVVSSRTGLAPFKHAWLVTLLLNLPWYVLLGPAAGTPEHVPPLLIMSLVFGTLFGFARQRGVEAAHG